MTAAGTALAQGDDAGPRLSSVPVLELYQVSKVYPGSPPVRALDQVSLAVTAGELTAMVGPSGSGKSTLLHLMGTLDKPTAGTVRVTGLDAVPHPGHVNPGDAHRPGSRLVQGAHQVQQRGFARP